MMYFVGSLSCVVLLLHLAAVSCHLEQEEEEEGGGWSVLEQGSGETNKTLELEPADEEEVNFYTVNIGDFFEGDIILTPNQRKQIFGDNEDQQKEAEEADEEEEGHREHDIHERAVVRNSAYKWPNAVVPFVISSSLPSTHVVAIQSAMRTYQEKTCIQFEPRSGQYSYVRFIRGRGCYSYIGRVGGVQDISIGDGCQNEGIVMHEIFHALGRWHEHSRPDRDSYITVNYNNIRNGLQDQFFKLSSSYSNGIAYDYSSVMHYSAYAFSRNRRPTITPRDSRVSLGTLGQRKGLSSRDYQHVESLYCNQVSAPQWSSWGNWAECSVSCGLGTQTRTRSCQSTGCLGSGTETRSCSSPGCPGQWSNWSSWGGCSPSCGTNRARSRSRSCQGQGGCFGESTQRESCADISCTNASQRPLGGMSEWASWGPCSRLCGGYQIRRRTCINRGLRCSTPYYQLRRCNVGSCSLDEEQNLQQQDSVQDDDADAAVMEPSSAGSGATAMASLLLGCAMITVATLMD